VILTKSGKLEVTAYLINMYVMRYGVSDTSSYDKMPCLHLLPGRAKVFGQNLEIDSLDL
jgi:hypothetical protein